MLPISIALAMITVGYGKLIIGRKKFYEPIIAVIFQASLYIRSE